VIVRLFYIFLIFSSYFLSSIANATTQSKALELFCSKALNDVPTSLNHPVEKRGYVTVPVDYRFPEGPNLKIFYRLIPSENHEPSELPTLVIVNGGPGSTSKGLRDYEFDYSVKTTEVNPLDRIKPLLEKFQVLVIDQRGTAGNSTRIELSQVGADYNLVSKYFGSLAGARDTESVVSTALPGQDFILVGQSYGGRIISQYLTSKYIKI
jgi:pimeloyl-ACP methyl ester carboxylesterase